MVSFCDFDAKPSLYKSSERVLLYKYSAFRIVDGTLFLIFDKLNKDDFHFALYLRGRPFDSEGCLVILRIYVD